MGVGVAEGEISVADVAVGAVVLGERGFEAVEAGEADVAEGVGVRERTEPWRP